MKVGLPDTTERRRVENKIWWTLPLMFDHLPDPELNMRRACISRFWTLKMQSTNVNQPFPGP